MNEPVQNLPEDFKDAGKRNETRGPGSGETSQAADAAPASPGLTFAKLPVEFGRYRVEKLLGSGAMGAVYLATDVQLDRQVAIKIPRLSKTGAAGLLKRMEREAKALAQLDHPNICRVYDFDVIGDIRFMVLEYVQGETLKSLLQRLGRKRKRAEAVAMIVQLARGLAVAHEKGVVHRDLKPENIMRRADGRLVIMDFGLNRQTRLAAEAAERTQNGTILGTPAYMSPEQAAGKLDAVDQRSDIYALGVMLYEMLTGELPFNGSAFEIMGRKTVLPAPSPLSVTPDLSPDLAEVCQKMLAQNAEDRYGTCGEVVKALKGCDLTARAAADPPKRGEEDNPLDFLQDLGSSGSHGPVRRSALHSAPGGLVASVVRWWSSMALSLRLSIVGAAGVFGLLLALLLQQGNPEKLQVAFDDPAANPGIGADDSKPVSSTSSPPDAVATNTAFEGTQTGETRELSLPDQVTLKLLWCAAGSFKMGNLSEAQGRAVDVELTRGYWIGITEVTQGQWKAVMGTTPWSTRVHGNGLPYRDGPDYPAVYISPQEMEQFCQRLTEIERSAGRLPMTWKYALPTEAQWEYACRAGTRTRYSFGDDPASLGDYAWYRSNTNDAGEDYPHLVATKKPNAWGVHDTHGNAWELCADAFAPDLPGGVDPFVAQMAPDANRVIRGGTWSYDASGCTSAIRFPFKPIYSGNFLGFRLAAVSDTTPIPPRSPTLSQELPSEKPIDLLSMVDPASHSLFGNWRRTERGLTCDRRPGARFMIPVALDHGYTLKCRVIRRSGREWIGVIVPVGQQQCYVLVDGWGGTLSGVGRVDGKGLEDLVGTAAAVKASSTHLVNGKEHELSVSVTSDNGIYTVSQALDGVSLATVSGPISRFSFAGNESLPCPRSVGIEAHDCVAEILSAELTLAAGAKGYALGEDWRCPLNSPASQPPADLVPRCLDRNGKKYFLSDREMSLTEAQLLALNSRGRLLSVSSRDELEFFRRNVPNKLVWHTGWRSWNSSGTWKDEFNRKLVIDDSFWVPGEPNNWQGTETQLSLANFRGFFGLNDANNWSKYHACIEWGEEE